MSLMEGRLNIYDLKLNTLEKKTINFSPIICFWLFLLNYVLISCYIIIFCLLFVPYTIIVYQVVIGNLPINAYYLFLPQNTVTHILATLFTKMTIYCMVKPTLTYNYRQN